MELIPWNEQREKVFLDRYAKKTLEGVLVEDRPEQMWKRVSDHLGRDENERRIFFSVLEGFKYVPSGRTLSGSGVSQKQTMFNCFGLEIIPKQPEEGSPPGRDSRKAIMDSIANIIEITSRGGGVGIGWRVLRPLNAYIKGVQGRSSGAIAWMTGCDSLVDAIRQGGSRTAALMYLLDCWHPDVIELIEPGRKFKRANYSINVTKEFMEALKEDGPWNLKFPETSDPFYDYFWTGDIKSWEAQGRGVKIYKTLPARQLWRRMADAAHATGNPGVVFLDRCNEESNTRYHDKLTVVNPCSEQPLPLNGSCNLGAVNLTAMWDASKKDLRWEELDLVVRTAIRFLDRVNDVSPEINKEISDVQRQTRRVGLGTMGVAEVLILKKLRYGSPESLKFIEALFSFIRNSAYSASVDLAMEFGKAPAFDKDKFMEGKFIKTLPPEIQKRIREHGLRNLALLTSAPTGTTSILAGSSSGIEPIFNKDYFRSDATGCHRVTHPLFIEDAGDHLVTAMDISVEDHINVQATLQKYVDSSISKTINMPSSASVENIMEAYQMAYDKGCKSISVYVNKGSDGALVPYCESCNA